MTGELGGVAAALGGVLLQLLAGVQRDDLRRVGHALPNHLAPPLGHPQHDGAALRVGKRSIRLPKTAVQTALRRLELCVDTLGAGLERGEEVELAHGGLRDQVVRWRQLRPGLCLRQERSRKHHRLADPVGATLYRGRDTARRWAR